MFLKHLVFPGMLKQSFFSPVTALIFANWTYHNFTPQAVQTPIETVGKTISGNIQPKIETIAKKAIVRSISTQFHGHAWTHSVILVTYVTLCLVSNISL